MHFFKKYTYVYALTVLAAMTVSLLASQTVTVVTTVFAVPEQPPLTVVIDPGHGGMDGGAVSCTGVSESELNLEIALKLDDLLTMLGIRTVMTRREDVSIHSPEAVTLSEKKVSDLKNRVNLVNQTPNPLLISIHQNMFEDPRYDGAQVFYARTAGSLQLAEQVQQVLCTELDPDNHRQAKESLSVYLMKKIQCTGILIECGFLSNEAEEAKLRNTAYQKQLACVITAGLTQYLAQTADGA